jgi:ornithine carbamoyltransferase
MPIEALWSRLGRAFVFFAAYADVPVIDAMADDFNHPTQVLNDVFTMYEKTGKIKGLNLTFVGVSKQADSASNVCRDLMLISSIMGINFAIASPMNYQVDEQFLRRVLENAAKSGSVISLTDDATEAVSQADFIYTDEFVRYETPKEEREKRKTIFIPKYQVNSELMRHAPATRPRNSCTLFQPTVTRKSLTM